MVDPTRELTPLGRVNFRSTCVLFVTMHAFSYIFFMDVPYPKKGGGNSWRAISPVQGERLIYFCLPLRATALSSTTLESHIDTAVNVRSTNIAQINGTNLIILVCI